MVTIDNFATVNLPVAMCINPNNPGYIYCSSTGLGKIYKINITNPLDNTEYVSGVAGASAMTFDNSNNLYSGTDDTITKITVDGQISAFVTNLPNITGLCFDRVNNVFYCARVSYAQGIFTIYQIDMNGNTTVYFSTNGYNISSLTIDDTTNTLYWSTGVSISKIIKNGSNIPISYPYASIPTTVSSIFYDNISNAVYCAGQNQTIYVVSDKANYTVISSGLIGNNSYILVYNQYLFATNYPSNKIAQITLDTIFVNNQHNKVSDDLPFSLNAISAYPQQIDYTSSNPSIATVDPSGIVTIQGMAGSATIGLSQHINQTTVIDASSVIIVTNPVNIASILINNINQLRYLTINPNEPSLLYYSSGDNNIYTVTRTNPTIQLYVSGVFNPYGITFDNSNNLYVENLAGSYISKTTPDKVTTNFIFSGDSLPLYFNPTQQLLYYGHDNFRIIFTADLYGNTTEIVSYNNSTTGVSSITGDITGKYIYIKSESTIFQLVKIINSNYYDPVVSISSITGSGGIVYVGGIVFYSAGNSIYALYPNNQSQLLFQSDLLSGVRDMILNIKDSKKISFYVSTSDSILNVKIYDNFTITPNITVNNTNTINKDVTSPPFYLNAYSQSITPITYASLDPSIATVDSSSGLVTIVNAGTCVIEALQYGYVDGTITYTDCSANITINVSNPVISVVPLFNKLVNDSNFNLNATSTVSTLPINYESLDPTVATVELLSGIVNIKGVGNCQIKLTQSYNGQDVSTAYTTVNVFANKLFGNVTAMKYDASSKLLYVCSNNEYPYNFITIDASGVTQSLNIPTTNANIKCINTSPNIYVGGTFNTISENLSNVNVSELKTTNVAYSSINLSVNSMFVDTVEYNQTIGVITTNNGTPFEISKK